VLLSYAFQLKILDNAQLDMMLVATALTMTLAPILSLLNERLILPRIGTKAAETRPIDHIATTHKIILVGFGHFGSTIGRFLRASGVEATILDHDSSQVDLLRKMGFKVYYGDATRMDLLEAAGISEAKILICAIDDPNITLPLAKILKEKYPNLKLMFRAKNRIDAYEFLEMGIENVYRESLETSVKLARDVLHIMGFRKYTVHRQAQKFIQYDEASLRRLAKKTNDKEEYLFRAKEEMLEQEKLLEQDLNRGMIDDGKQWDTEQMRIAAKRK
jgi:CPA2 family monovalent cation:H+ antiporter-2